MSILFIVESPGKIKKISSILGHKYNVQASIGHIRDLPTKEMGINPNTWSPTYVNTNIKAIQNLKNHAKSATDVIIATDDDREGEAIGWHIAKVLGLDPKVCRRIVYSEITKKAIDLAISNQGKINMRMVAAQEARRFLDRILGYTISPLLSDCLPNFTGLSAGRVQSVALKIVALRELAITDFIVTEHFTLQATFEKDSKEFKAVWEFKKHFGGQGLPSNINSGNQDYWLNRNEMMVLVKTIQTQPVCIIREIVKKESLSKPPAPFITSTFQMACSSQLKIAPKKAMEFAQKLYEDGLITYMRTDNPNLSDDAIIDCRSFIEKWCMGRQLEPGRYLPTSPNKWKSKGGAQEAHEAIRPVDMSETGSSISDPDKKRVYQMIFKRTIACQMEVASFDVTSAQIETQAVCAGKKVMLTAKGKIMTFAGWKAFNTDFSEDNDQADDGDDQDLPVLHSNETLPAIEAAAIAKKTSPPPRYTSATLIRQLEKEGVGRPSTYASIIDTITRREYVEILDNKTSKLGATKKGIAVFEAMDKEFDFMDIKYTKNTEEDLDKVADGQLQFKAFMTEFYRRFSVQAEDFRIIADKRSGSEICPLCNKHRLKKFKNKKRPGNSWLCKGRFSESANDKCTAIYPDIKGSPDLNAKPPEMTDHQCPKCTKGLTRYYRDEKFTFCCTGCKVYIPGNENQPDYKCYEDMQLLRSHALTCPQCNSGKLLECSGKYGKYYSCDAYPKCRVNMQVDVKGKPDVDKYLRNKAELELLPTCQKCKKGKMKLRSGSKGDFLGCTNFPKCRAVAEVETTAKTE
jgi:DNA topoisomerase-1